MKLEEVLGKYGVPDPKIVGKLPKGGIQLDFVGHADVTKMLIEIDPEWTWEPTTFDDNGLPAYRVENGMAHMAGWLTIHGVRRLGIGSVQASKPDLLKELCSDFIRNASMRFGVCLSLWTKQEWDTDDAPAKTPTKAQVGSRAVAPKPAQVETPAEPEEDKVLTQQQVKQFVDACDKIGLDPAIVASKAQLNWDGQILQSQLPLLRDAFTILKTGL
jgi:hypothetical protein